MSVTTTPSIHSRAETSLTVWQGWITVFAGGLLLYALTASRGPQWQDSGEHIIRIISGEVGHRLGLALSHPLHFYLGQLANGLGSMEPALAITLVSSFAGAITLANLFGCVFTLTGDKWAAIFAAVSLGVAHTFWQMSTRTEVYTITTALLAGECWALIVYAQHRRGWYLVFAFFLNGLGVTNHMLAILTTPVLGFVLMLGWWRGTIGRKHVLFAASAWTVGSLLYTVMIVMEAVRSQDFPTAIHLALFGQTFADQVLSISVTGKGLLIILAFLVLNFPNGLIPSAMFAVTSAGREVGSQLIRRALFTIFILQAVFALRYQVVDQHYFLLSTYLLLCIFGGMGFASYRRSARSTSKRFVIPILLIAMALTPLSYFLVPSLARSFDVLKPYLRNKPYRDDYAYIFTPWSVTETSATEMSRHAVDLAGPRGLIFVEDLMSSFAIRYAVKRSSETQVEVLIDLLPQRLRSMVESGGNVVLVPAHADEPRTMPPLGYWRRDGDLYVLKID